MRELCTRPDFDPNLIRNLSAQAVFPSAARHTPHHGDWSHHALEDVRQWFFTVLVET